MQKLTLGLLTAITLISCSASKNSELAAFEVFCEMVANDAKPVALAKPMSGQEMDEGWEDFEKVAANYKVKIYREVDFPITQLWPVSVTKGKEVVVIYKGDRLVQYQQFKSDLAALEPVEAARRLGRLLGYSSQGINQLLMNNTSFRSLQSFGVKKQVTHLYYEDLVSARDFYERVLGLEQTDEGVFKISEGAFLSLHSLNDQHPKNQPKSTAIALLTDQLSQWYTHVQENNVPIKYTYKPKDGGPHDGFVAIDPGGYLLEFEQFKQHPENELFMAVLEQSPRIKTKVGSLNFYGSITWTYHNDLLKMQKFYEEDLGFMLVADQGWTKIYQTTSSTFIGLVDERRGMMDYADMKAVEIEWNLEESEEAKSYFSKSKNWDAENDAIMGPEKYWYLIR